MAQGKDGKIKFSEIPLETSWIKSGKEKATVPYKGLIIRGDKDHSILYIDEHGLRKSSAFIESMVQGRPIMIGVKTRKETNTKVFSGPIKVSQEDLKSFEECNLELAEVMNSKW
jgi:hypothetical protein